MTAPFMLDVWSPFVPSEYRVKFAVEAWEKAGCKALRRMVFCQEQAIFPGDDEDETDACAIPLAAVSYVLGAPDQVVGTVRIHEEKPRVWWGSRLAVHRDFRRAGGLGAGLIRLAVGSANAMGCKTFLAHVQAQNVALFERLNWRSREQVLLHGRPHHLMEADLAHYPPIANPEIGFMTIARAAS
jgi:putative N-acetyltransferase (TIGR04045 family)